MDITTELIARFDAKVDRSAGPDACHPWTASRKAKGYGQISVEGRPHPAHRVAWAIAHPGQPLPAVVMHRCDNPPCCNPAHLQAGTTFTNNRDCIEKGRSNHFGRATGNGLEVLRGERHPRAILDEDTVRRIAALRVDGHTYAEIVALTGVKTGTVAQILTGRKWKHLDLPIVSRRNRPRQ